jgi:hypothetical protein
MQEESNVNELNSGLLSLLSETCIKFIDERVLWHDVKQNCGKVTSVLLQGKVACNINKNDFLLLIIFSLLQ